MFDLACPSPSRAKANPPSALTDERGVVFADASAVPATVIDRESSYQQLHRSGSPLLPSQSAQ
jgi:hypothetical protein